MSAFVNKTIGKVIQETAARYPTHPALICPQFSTRLTYRELYEQCRKTAKGLMALGIRRGDHVSVWTTNVPEWIYLQFALGMTGGVLVTINTNYQSHELEYILKQSDSTTLFLIDSYRDTSFYNTVCKIAPELEKSQPGALASRSVGPWIATVRGYGNKKSVHFIDSDRRWGVCTFSGRHLLSLPPSIHLSIAGASISRDGDEGVAQPSSHPVRRAAQQRVRDK